MACRGSAKSCASAVTRACSRTTIARLMGICGAVGIHYRRRGGCTRPGDGDLSDDLVNRAFDPDGPDRLWCMG